MSAAFFTRAGTTALPLAAGRVMAMMPPPLGISMA
jgi:hypothetical protein